MHIQWKSLSCFTIFHACPSPPSPPHGLSRAPSTPPNARLQLQPASPWAYHLVCVPPAPEVGSSSYLRTASPPLMLRPLTPKGFQVHDLSLSTSFFWPFLQLLPSCLEACSPPHHRVWTQGVPFQPFPSFPTFTISPPAALIHFPPSGRLAHTAPLKP